MDALNDATPSKSLPWPPSGPQDDAFWKWPPVQKGANRLGHDYGVSFGIHLHACERLLPYRSVALVGMGHHRNVLRNADSVLL